ncbi:GcvT family protein [Aestuariispira insulae]|uniref:Dimethylglycine dehydrogenase n=1 Tax=Aestuariispira insulae TaxID=1461337 RepID=A0A3D9H8I3_9PROT|nr:FAD-dependent oxidoreductase [Aestuariispira insulae]RED45785.1 dimethylglycine dehydrogenase [Aestuariispira insulae]
MEMNNTAQAVVIGGGLVGCSILYHLAKLGWTDVMLLERSELTSGSTWHAAAGVHGLHDNNNISKLQYYTMKLYAELEQETGQSCGIHKNGYIYLAQTEDREHQLRIQAAKAKYFGVDFYELSLDEVRKMHPLVNLEGIRCAFHEPDAGHVDPSGVTYAYAQGARQRGAAIHRFTPVIETNQRADGTWDVVTPNGTVHTQVVINVAGLWGREVAKLAGFELPLMTMEHQYFVTENIPEIEGLDYELPAVADRDGEYYLRQEGKGLLVGAYEKDGRFWAEEGTPLDFGHELLPDDLDRITENVMRACERIPALGEAGIKRVINGPMIWTPDSAALFGPVPELKNYYCCNGIIPGFSQSGGLGMMLAQWVVEGEPELDMFPWDLARYGKWADKKFTKERALDCYSHRFKIHFPYEERAAGRAVRTRPLYEIQKDMGAVFGLNYGWEHPLWFAGESVEPKEDYGYTRQNWHGPVGEECEALRAGAGLIDISNFAKYEIKGAGAADWLNRIVANRVPGVDGRSCLTPLLSVRGGIAGDFTITKLADDHFMMFGSGMAERYHQRFFQMVEKPESVTFESLTESHCGFNLAGPNAREILSRLTEGEDLSNEGLRFMRSRPMKVAGCDALVLRVSFTGDLGYEIYMKEEDQVAVYQAILEAGQDLGIRPVGGRALLSLRVEKGYGSWGREYSPEYWPQEVGLDGLIKLDKEENFLGKQAYLALKDKAPREKLVSLSVETPFNADAVGGEPIFALDGTPVGRVSSGAFGHTVGTSLALGFVKTAHLKPGAEFDIAILGKPHRAKLLETPLFDPKGERLRS